MWQCSCWKQGEECAERKKTVLQIRQAAPQSDFYAYLTYTVALV